jgi:hypothetical protein
VHNWSPSAPHPLRRVWEGTVTGQGQLRLRGALIPVPHLNTHQLREAYAINRQQAFDDLKQGGLHHLPEGAYHHLQKEKIWLGIPCPDILLRGNERNGWDKEVTFLLVPKCAQPAFCLNHKELHVPACFPMHIDFT